MCHLLLRMACTERGGGNRGGNPGRWATKLCGKEDAFPGGNENLLKKRLNEGYRRGGDAIMVVVRLWIEFWSRGGRKREKV